MVLVSKRSREQTADKNLRNSVKPFKKNAQILVTENHYNYTSNRYNYDEKQHIMLPSCLYARQQGFKLIQKLN